MEEIVKRISQILEEQQLSSSAFADTIGVQRSSISHVLSGRNKPSLEFILKIIRAFPSYSTDWLLFGKQTDAAKAYQQPADNTAENQVKDLDFTSESYDTPEKPTEPPTVSKSESEIAKVILLAQLGRTPFFKKEKPSPLDEARSLMWYLDNVFYHSVSNIHQYIKNNIFDGKDFENPL